MSEMVWQDPPPIERGDMARNTVTRDFVASLAKNPGRWALYPRTMKNGTSVTTYRRNYPGTQWTRRKREDGRYDMYARWIGEQP